MKVMVIVKGSAKYEAGAMPDQALLEKMGKYNEELVKAGIMQAGEGIHPSSKGFRIQYTDTKPTVIDGPFAEAKELVAGFWIWKVKSMERGAGLGETRRSRPGTKSSFAPFSSRMISVRRLLPSFGRMRSVFAPRVGKIKGVYPYPLVQVQPGS